MKLPSCDTLLLNEHRGVLSITLNRPHKRNAMNAQMVAEIMAVFSAIDNDHDVRAVVLRGSGGHFCAGADIAGMHRTASDDVNADPERALWSFNRSFGRLVSMVNSASQVVVVLLEGAVMGGGFGLACASDVAIADRCACFALPETGLGVVPAQIAPFVVARIGLTQARRLALLGEKIDGSSALELGLVHFLVDDAQAMVARLDDTLSRVRRCAPGANAATKQLMLNVGNMELEALLDHAADCFVDSMRGAEGQEGTRAFMQKRQPCWAVSTGAESGNNADE